MRLEHPDPDTVTTVTDAHGYIYIDAIPDTGDVYIYSPRYRHAGTADKALPPEWRRWPYHDYPGGRLLR
jgi:hypothetical protein